MSGSLHVAHSREATKKENEIQMLNTQTKMVPKNLQNNVEVLKWGQKVTQDHAKKNTKRCGILPQKCKGIFSAIYPPEPS